VTVSALSSSLPLAGRNPGYHHPALFGVDIATQPIDRTPSADRRNQSPHRTEGPTMTTTQITDPWATTDHDPISIATAATLEEARSDIHAANAAIDDPHRRNQYALSARDNAVTVLLAGDANPDELRHAEHYLADAEAIIANP
jgi:hypothetical protein